MSLENKKAEITKKVGILGFGKLGQFLYQQLQGPQDAGLQLDFIWSRSSSTLLEHGVPGHLILEDLQELASRPVDLIVEVCHPAVVAQHAPFILQHADLLVGSPAALADEATETKVKAAADFHAVYIPSGAFWGAVDIFKMADTGTLEKLKVTMKKHPNSLKVNPEDFKLLEHARQNLHEPTVLYDGPVRHLCLKAPQNTNTMAAAALAAHNLGFDGVSGCLVADSSLGGQHQVEVEVWGSGGFRCHTTRLNPAAVGEVTGTATCTSFWASLKIAAYGHWKTGIQFC